MQELSERTNISQSQISNYEKDTRNPSFANMAKIADVFEVSLDWFAIGLDGF
jgi:transcriptional regulator with XRE-family HTH domain